MLWRCFWCTKFEFQKILSRSATIYRIENIQYTTADWRSLHYIHSVWSLLYTIAFGVVYLCQNDFRGVRILLGRSSRTAVALLFVVTVLCFVVDVVVEEKCLERERDSAFAAQSRKIHGLGRRTGIGPLDRVPWLQYYLYCRWQRWSNPTPSYSTEVIIWLSGSW